MTCICPPELEDAQLLAYLDGEADQKTAEHLEKCDHCRERTEHLARFSEHLATSLYRATCPSPADLGEYHLGLLARDDATAIKGHLAFYPHLVDACYVDGERVQAQAGGFYGGWITSDIVGPFKGEPGTWGW